MKQSPRFEIGDILYGVMRDISIKMCRYCNSKYDHKQFFKPVKFLCEQITIYKDHIEYGNGIIVKSEYLNFADYESNRIVFKTLKECQEKCREENTDAK